MRRNKPRNFVKDIRYTKQQWLTCVENGYMNVMQDYLDNGWDINTKTQTYNSLYFLLRFSDTERPEVITFLIENGIDTENIDGNNTSFMDYCIGNHKSKSINTGLKLGLEVDVKKFGHSIHWEYEEPQRIIFEHRPELVSMLIDYNIPIKEKFKKEYGYLLDAGDLGLL